MDEALMIEPTESEGKEALDAFCEAMLAIAREAEEEPELVRGGEPPPRPRPFAEFILSSAKGSG